MASLLVAAIHVCNDDSSGLAASLAEQEHSELAAIKRRAKERVFIHQ